MSRSPIIIVFFALAPTTVLAQRIPGRVGGSPNNPQANRPSKAKTDDTAGGRAFAVAPLTPDQIEEYQRAKALMPDLSRTDFQKLSFFRDQINVLLSKQMTAVDLAARLHQRHGDIARVLRDVGLSKKAAKELIEKTR
jgi:hypothetical protein